MTDCTHCGATWAGKRIEHCTECHESFTGTASGDKHRTGEHHLSLGPYRRRCLTTVEMALRGMVRNSRGVWTLGGVNPWVGVAPGAPNTTSDESLDPGEETRTL